MTWPSVQKPCNHPSSMTRLYAQIQGITWLDVGLVPDLDGDDLHFWTDKSSDTMSKRQ